jgi:hypothetical protein
MTVNNQKVAATDKAQVGRIYAGGRCRLYENGNESILR